MKKQLYFFFASIILLLTASIWWEYFRLRIPKVFVISVFLNLVFLCLSVSRYFLSKYFLLALIASGTFFLTTIYSPVGIIATCSVIIPQTMLLPFACAGIFMYVLVKNDYKLLKIVLVITAIFVSYTAIKTSLAEVNSSRIFFGNAFTQEALYKVQENLENALMGYAQIHSIPLIMVGVVYMVKRSENVWVKGSAAFVGILCLYALVRSGYTAATMATGLAVLMSMISAKRCVFTMILMMPMIVILIIMVKSGVLLSILEGIKPLLPDESALGYKINEFADMQTTVNGSGYWNFRSVLYQLSWECFIRNPMLGVGWGNGGGGHSFLLDYLAQTGLVGFIPFFVLYFMIYKFIHRVLNKEAQWCYFTVFVTYMLLLAYKGPGIIAQNHIVYLVVPLTFVVNKRNFYIASVKMRRLMGLGVPLSNCYLQDSIIARQIV